MKVEYLEPSSEPQIVTDPYRQNGKSAYPEDRATKRMPLNRKVKRTPREDIYRIDIDYDKRISSIRSEQDSVTGIEQNMLKLEECPSEDSVSCFANKLFR